MKVAGGRVDITPQLHLELGGSSKRRVGRRRNGKLEANIAVIWPSVEGSKPLVLVSLDLLYPGRALTRGLVESLPEIPRERLFVASSHTHQAPMTDDSKPLLGKADPNYLESLTTRIAAEIRRLLMEVDREDVTLSAATGLANHSVNRRSWRFFYPSRRPRFGSTAVAPNRDGARDETVEVVVATGASGRRLFVLWNYACHPVSFPDQESLAADFPGVVRDALRERSIDKDLPVLFFQGFSGNTRPVASIQEPRGRPQGFLCAILGQRFGLMSWEAYGLWSASLADVVVGVFGAAVPVKPGDVLCSRETLPLARFVGGAPIGSEIAFQAVRLGPDIILCGVSAELVAEYALRLRSLITSRHLFCVGCLDDTFGYLPTDQIVLEGGYEGGGFCEIFGLEEFVDGVSIDAMVHASLDKLIGPLHVT